MQYRNAARASSGLATACLLLLLSACATAPVSLIPHQSWAEREAALSALEGWSLSGRMVLRRNGESWNANIHWIQRADSYQLSFHSLFGQRVAELQGDQSGATMTLPDEPADTATSVSALLKKHLGWRIPVDGLRYWVIGLPVPDMPAKTELDPEGHLHVLEQSGWRIEYAAYRTVGNVDLPRKINFSHPQLQTRMVIDQWELVAAVR